MSFVGPCTPLLPPPTHTSTHWGRDTYIRALALFKFDLLIERKRKKNKLNLFRFTKVFWNMEMKWNQMEWNEMKRTESKQFESECNRMQINVLTPNCARVTSKIRSKIGFKLGWKYILRQIQICEQQSY